MSSLALTQQTIFTLDSTKSLYEIAYGKKQDVTVEIGKITVLDLPHPLPYKESQLANLIIHQHIAYAEAFKAKFKRGCEILRAVETPILINWVVVHLFLTLAVAHSKAGYVAAKQAVRSDFFEPLKNRLPQLKAEFSALF